MVFYRSSWVYVFQLFRYLTKFNQVTAAREALATLKPQAALAAQQPAAPAPTPVNVVAPSEPARPEPMEVETQLVPIGKS